MKSRRILEEDIDIHFDDLDYENPETLRLFKELLGDQFHRLVIMKHREPKNVHYE